MDPLTEKTSTGNKFKEFISKYKYFIPLVVVGAVIVASTGTLIGSPLSFFINCQ